MIILSTNQTIFDWWKTWKTFDWEKEELKDGVLTFDVDNKSIKVLYYPYAHSPFFKIEFLKFNEDRESAVYAKTAFNWITLLELLHYMATNANVVFLKPSLRETYRSDVSLDLNEKGYKHLIQSYSNSFMVKLL